MAGEAAPRDLPGREAPQGDRGGGESHARGRIRQEEEVSREALAARAHIRKLERRYQQGLRLQEKAIQELIDNYYRWQVTEEMVLLEVKRELRGQRVWTYGARWHWGPGSAGWPLGRYGREQALRWARRGAKASLARPGSPW